MKVLKFLLKIPSKIGVKLIELYQFTISPDHGIFKARYPYGFCRHYPSCSEYAKQAIIKGGLIKGAWLGVIRIAKCNPWIEPSVDNLKLV